ncbi:MAG TPA: hypothetical protein DCP97_02685 [Ruminococcaceae bacterium]|nr:hypothetical protein [Oscillospiraceae bacterium]
MLTYKGKPIVRNGNTIYYGDMSDDYVAMLQILSTKQFNDIEMANKVSVQIIATNTELKLKDRIIKKTEKNGLYEAINIASIWLERISEE